MMIGIALALAAQAAQPARTPEEIVVTASRMNRIEYGLRLNRRTGRTECQIKRSSGDAVLDGMVCGLVNECSSSEPRVRGQERSMAANIVACVRRGRERLLDTYAAQAGAR